jgi:hypothetical protein
LVPYTLTAVLFTNQPLFVAYQAVSQVL